MRAYTTGFFIVSRFLPRARRDDVQVIYAAVRYPDEVVDTFPLAAAEREARLDRWAADYEAALAAPSLTDALRSGLNCFVSAFADLVRRVGIPPVHYRDFLGAMRLDIRPPRYATLDDLVDRYVHGSAIVVGYFLAHAYGASAPAEMPRALKASRDLGVALQLTNFLRDVAEDQRRGRLYLPLDWLREEGVAEPDASDPAQAPAFGRVIRRVAEEARRLYREAAANLDAFSPGSRTAIRACIDVYGALNDRILASPRGMAHRESVPFREKWAVLPVSKYWRLPWTYLTRT
jgi:phytoene synthase